MSEKPQGPYTLWLDYGYEGWKPTDFATLRAALEADKYSSNWHISRPATYSIIEISENQLVPKPCDADSPQHPGDEPNLAPTSRHR